MFGRSSAPRAAPPPPKSIIAKLAPLLIFFSIVGAAAYIGYQIYVALLGISDAAAKKLEDSNLSVSKDGLKVKVKEMHQEEYGDGMQR